MTQHKDETSEASSGSAKSNWGKVRKSVVKEESSSDANPWSSLLKSLGVHPNNRSGLRKEKTQLSPYAWSLQTTYSLNNENPYFANMVSGTQQGNLLPPQQQQPMSYLPQQQQPMTMMPPMQQQQPLSAGQPQPMLAPMPMPMEMPPMVADPNAVNSMNAMSLQQPAPMVLGMGGQQQEQPQMQPPMYAPPPAYIPMPVAQQMASNTATAFADQDDASKYGLCFFSMHFISQKHRIFGTVASIGVVVMFLEMCWKPPTTYFVYLLDVVRFEYVWLALYLGPAVLLIICNLFKMYVKKMTCCSCFWPGLHIAILGGMAITSFFVRTHNFDYNGEGGETFGALPLLAVSSIAYLICVYCNSDLKGVMSRPRYDYHEAGMEVSDACTEKPAVSIYGEAYHYETRTRTVTDSEGNTSTETYQEKVVTSSETEAFTYQDVRVVGREAFNVNDFESDPRFNKKIAVFSARFFTVVGDNETRQAIDAAVSVMYGKMAMRDSHASASWSKKDKFLSFTIFPNCSSEKMANKKSFLLRTCCIIASLTGNAFGFLCLLGTYANNPVYRFAKEISVNQFEQKGIVVVNHA